MLVEGRFMNQEAATIARGRATPPLRILTWHVHGNYLLYLSQTPHEFILPVKRGRPNPYGGRAGSFPWPANVREVPAESVHEIELDCILYQHRANWDAHQYEILSEGQ